MVGNERTLDELGAAKEPEFDPVTAALRLMHDSVASETIPDDFLILLDKIDSKMSAHKKLQ